MPLKGTLTFVNTDADGCDGHKPTQDAHSDNDCVVLLGSFWGKNKTECHIQTMQFNVSYIDS